MRVLEIIKINKLKTMPKSISISKKVLTNPVVRRFKMKTSVRGYSRLL